MMDAGRLLNDAALSRVLSILNQDGEEARVVGGAVRNALLGRPATDIDIATTALPDRVMAWASEANMRVIPTGLAHGTVTLKVGERMFEVTTLREDIETDGRHAKIRFGRDFALDARRRDFTINALSLSGEGVVHDYTEGRADLAASRVRFIGDPVTRIREDYLRILRFFRFSAEYATGALDAAGLAACIAERGGLARLSRERIHQELMKLLDARRVVFALTEMSDGGLFDVLLGGIARPANLRRLLACEPEACSLLRLAAAATFVPDDVPRLQDRLRLSNADTTRLMRATRLAAAWHDTDLPAPNQLREALFAEGRAGAIDGLHLAWANRAAEPDGAAWRKALRFLQDTPEPHLPFSSADLMARGVPAGRALGEALKRLQANWIKAGFPQDPRALANLLDEVAPS